MPCYMIVVATVSDREAFMRDYAQQAAELLAAHGGRYRLRAPGATLLEGTFGEGASVVISEWDSREAALGFWNSPEYTRLRELRQPLATCQLLLIDAPHI
jgi:uncharacterized protein (DUF1330 family)